LVRKDWLSFGIETETEWQDEAMHFYFDQEVVEKGVAWVFPCGSYSRIGVASYQGQTSLKSCLVRFLEKLRAPLREIHGGYFPHALRPPVVDGLFLVGDSAGQCIPLTGEGIRTSIYFGLLCGEIVQGVIGGLHSLEYGLRAYAQEVRRYRRFFRVFFLAQQAFVRAPESLAAAAFAFISRDYCMNYIQDRYEVLSNLRLPGKGVSMVAGDSLRHGRQEVAEDLGEEG
jgi:flavin-dependent dehydrogenase